MPPTAHNDDDVGYRLLVIVLPFQDLPVAQIATQDCPSPATNACASNDNSWNSSSGFVSNYDRSTRQHDPGNPAEETRLRAWNNSRISGSTYFREGQDIPWFYLRRKRWSKCLPRVTSRWKTCREILVPAHEAGDESTVALVPVRMRVHEKTAWMLRAIQ